MIMFNISLIQLLSHFLIKVRKSTVICLMVVLYLSNNYLVIFNKNLSIIDK